MRIRTTSELRPVMMAICTPDCLQHDHAVAVFGVERLVFLSVVADEQAAVGQHAVDVENDQADRLRLFHVCPACLRSPCSDHACAQQVVHVERAAQTLVGVDHQQAR